MKIRKKLSLNNPKAIALIAVAVLVIGAGIWFLASRQWQTVASDAKQQSSRANELKQRITTKGSREEHLNAIKALASLQDVSCQGSWWYDWQTAVWPGSGEAKKTCQKLSGKVDSLITAAQSLSRHLKNEEKITEQLGALVIDSRVKDWQTKALSASSTVYDELSSLTVSSTAQPVLKEATERVKEVKAAWKALNVASSKKDRTDYETALNRLDDAYAQLASVTEVSDTELSTLVTSIKALR